MKKDRNSLYSADPQLSSASSHNSTHVPFTYPMLKPAHLPLPHPFHWCTAYLSISQAHCVKWHHNAWCHINTKHQIISTGNFCGSEFGKILLFFQNIKLLDLISLVLEVFEFTAIEGDPSLCPGTLTLPSAGAGRKGEDRINTVGGHL